MRTSSTQPSFEKRRQAMRILVAGIGNIFLGDDAFGVDVAQALMQQELPEGVQVANCGIRNYDLAYALMDGYDAAILVDATQQGGPPGTLYVIEPEPDEQKDRNGDLANAHSMNPAQALRMVQSLGGHTGKLYLVGCEPEVLVPEEGYLGLSQTVQQAVPRAVRVIQSLIQDLIRSHPNTAPSLTKAPHA